MTIRRSAITQTRDDRREADREYAHNAGRGLYEDPATPPAVNRPLREAEKRYIMEQAARLGEEREQQ